MAELDLAALIPATGTRLLDLIKPLGGLSEEDFLVEVTDPFLLQVPMEKKGAGPGASSDALTAKLGQPIPESNATDTLAISRSSIMGLQRSKGVHTAIIHRIASRSGDERVSVGRAEDCDLVLNDATVSKQHATLHSNLGTWFVTDLGSHNGTHLDGKRLEASTSVPLEAMQSVWFSSYRAVFLFPEHLFQLLRNIKGS